MKAALAHIAELLQAYGPWGLFVFAMIESVGVPLPGAADFLLIGVGAACAKAGTPGVAYFTVAMAVAGSLLGNFFLFTAAEHGRKLIRTKTDPPPPGKPQRFREWFNQYGLLTVFVPAVVPVIPLPLKVFVITAGAMHTSRIRFLLVILIARIIRYLALAQLGLALGEDAKGFLLRNGWPLTAAALLLGAVLYYAIRRANRPTPA